MIDLTQSEILIFALSALILGMILLLKGGGWTIDSAVFVAQRLGLSPLIIGFTVVAVGTSLPELLVSMNANLQGLGGMAVGNVIGSNIANILLICGFTALLINMVVDPRTIYRDAIKMVFATCVMTFLIVSGHFSRGAGLFMVVALIVYVLWQYSLARKGKAIVPEAEAGNFSSMKMALLFLALGLAAIAFGAEFLVRGAEVAATILGVPDDVIGLSVIAVGTSLPELSTCIIAAMRRQTDLIIGNILGSNVFNIFMILGITSLIKPIENAQIAPQVAQFDVWVMLGVTSFFALLLYFYKQINKPVGFLFCGGYILYIFALYALYLN